MGGGKRPVERGSIREDLSEERHLERDSQVCVQLSGQSVGS